MQTFGPQLAAQISEPLQFVDYLREPKRDEVRLMWQLRALAAWLAGWLYTCLNRTVRWKVPSWPGAGVAVAVYPCHCDRPALQGAPRAALHFTFPDLAHSLHTPARSAQTTGEVIEARPSCYESVAGGMEEVRRRVEAFMHQFNEGSRAMKMELVLFQGERVLVLLLMCW